MFDAIGNVFDLIITQPIAFIYRFIFDVAGSYGWALLLFTIVVKLLLLPLNIKSKRGMKAQQELAPKMKELDKFKQDKQRYQEEVQKLYSENNINPLGGCLPSLIQMPLLIAIYGIVTKPLSYIMRLSKDQVTNVIEFLNDKLNLTEPAQMFNFNQQIPIAEAIKSHMDSLTAAFPDLSGKLMEVNFHFLGLDLAQKPEFSSFSWLWLIPILSGVSSFFVSYIMQKMQQSKNPGANEAAQAAGGAAGSMKAMLYIMPLFSVWIGFTLPSGVGLYWIMSNLMSLAIEPLAGLWIDWRNSKKPQPVISLTENGKDGQKEKKPQLDQVMAKEQKLLREQRAASRTGGDEENEAPDGEVFQDDEVADAGEEIVVHQPKTGDKYSAYKNRSKKKKKK